MKKLLIVTSGLPASDRRSWSGIPFSIKSRLENSFEIHECTINQWGRTLALKETSFRSFLKGDRLTAAGLWLLSWRQAQIIKRSIRQVQPDCILCFEVVTTNAIAFLKTDIPLIHYTDSVAASMVDYYWHGLGRHTQAVMNMLQKRSLETCDAVLMASEWAKESAIRHYGTDPGKLTIIPFGANTEVKDFQHLDHEEINLLFVGVGWQRKGGDIAVECAEWLNRKDPGRNYVLHLVGSEPPVPIDSDHVRLYGFLNRNVESEREKLEYLRSITDLFLLPTQAECAGIVFCEACAYGIPSVTYDTGGISSYVINGFNGYRMPCGSSGEQFADKILELLQDRTLLPKMKTNARSLYETDLNWDTAARRVTEVIHSLTDR